MAGRYGKRFGTGDFYWQPQIQFTWAHLEPDEYDVSYIFVGSKEREKYGEALNEDVLKSLGEVVFQDEVYSTYILKINK